MKRQGCPSNQAGEEKIKRKKEARIKVKNGRLSGVSLTSRWWMPSISGRIRADEATRTRFHGGGCCQKGEAEDS